MKRFYALICFPALLILVVAAGTFSPVFDRKGFVGGVFTGNASGLTNYSFTNYFCELRQTAGQSITLPLAGSVQRITNWTSSVNVGGKFGINLTGGYITNLVDGYVTIAPNLNISGPDIDNYNFYVQTNDVNVPWAYASFTLAGASYVATVRPQTTIWLPANTRISVIGFCDVQAEPSTVVSYSTFTVTKESQ